METNNQQEINDESVEYKGLPITEDEASTANSEDEKSPVDALFKVGDIVRFKDSRSENATFFENGLNGLEVQRVYGDELIIYESDKSDDWVVDINEVELDTCPEFTVDEFEKLHHLRKYNIGSFLWAVEQMKEGKKVRRNIWSDNTKYVFQKAYYYISDSKTVEFNIYDFEATDWEIFKEYGPYRKEICNIVSKMLDNPDDYGIYPTGIYVIENSMI